MASKKFLHQLYNAHTVDLETVVPNLAGLFVCPICLRIFDRDSVDKRILTDGHVWPKDIREASNSEEIKNQRVLLCGDCNSTAGHRGDAQMGVLEMVRQGEKSGELFGERTIQVLISSASEPIKLNARVTRTGNSNYRLSFETKRNSGIWTRNNPQDQKRFQAIRDSGSSCTLITDPPKELDTHLAQVGWITSGYLFAFYRFGYRYILHQEVSPIRDYILESFHRERKDPPNLPVSDTLNAFTCDTHFEKDPLMLVSIPLDSTGSVTLFITLLDYHVTLPFHFVPEVLQELIEHIIKKNHLTEADLKKLDDNLYIPVQCTKMNVHECVWDIILGKPIDLRSSENQ